MTTIISMILYVIDSLEALICYSTVSLFTVPLFHTILFWLFFSNSPFRWDQLGKYDIPANINYILATNGQSKLVYVGHSLGSASFFIAMIKHPELKDKIDMMIALSPSSTFMNFNNYLQYFFPFSKKIQVKWFLFDYIPNICFLAKCSPWTNMDQHLCQIVNVYLLSSYFAWTTASFIQVDLLVLPLSDSNVITVSCNQFTIYF